MILLALAAAPLAAQEHEGATLQQRAAASRAKGSESAPVLVLEVADFQCPYCARFWKETFPRLDSAYIRPGKVRWVFVNLPLPTHPHAWSAAEAALCAGALAGDFWSAHDQLFARQEEWAGLPDPVAAFVTYVAELGVPEADFRACIDRDVVAPLILEDVIFAARSGVRGTPAFFINRDQAVIGLKSFEDWDRLLQEALRRAAGGSPP
ncbi:MAG TPA: thioredoxin domain-containing protein [Longimicrobiales bacterium]